MVLDSWLRPSGGNLSWFNLKHTMLLSFVIFKFVEWTADCSWLPIYSIASYMLILGMSYSLGFVVCRWLKRHHLSLSIASYRKAVLITGCDTGFGNMLARKLAPRGFQVLAGCLRADSPEAVRLNAIPNVDVISLDVTKPESLEAALQIVSSKLNDSGNDLWAVVCNAGICEIGELEWQPMESIQRMFDVNVMGTVRTAKTFLPMLRRTKGRIVITASVLSNVSSPGFVGYSMTKAAVASLAEGLKRELQVWDIDVCSVQPALYSTGLLHVAEAKNDFLNEQMPKMPDHVRMDYGHEYFIAFWNMMSKFYTDYANPHPEEAVNALYHAITTVFPETHYRVGSWRQTLYYNMLDFMPIEVADLCLDKVMKPAVEPNAVLKI